MYDGLALNGVSFRVVDPDGDHDATHPRTAPDGTVGPIELRSPSLLRCYRDGTDPTRGDGWFRTGDLGRIDPNDRRLSVQGRSDDLIITGGEKVWPDPVERILVSDERVRGRRGDRSVGPRVGSAGGGGRGAGRPSGPRPG